MAARKLFISIAAGIPIRKMEALLYAPLDEGMRKKLPIIRVMPNTPALVLAGMSGMSANANATPEDLETTRTILGALGKVMEFKEADLDAVTALSGSGPAYVFYFIESMIAGGLAAGLEPDASETLTLQTLEGALKLLRERKEPPEDLRRKVTSPGGTTEAALKVMESHQVKQNIVAAIVAAARRSQELSR
jgi:pyrroline-5-carboxylate reductase